ncbi:hypothetical protein [Kribbella catacumbae]|uniref:hypothetical protein n=1 Tax=Kribbella catacumbae TaxID=460086 RepID=UPI00036B15B0|nr:hypothetical protein [Kribbella catacumbae]
MTILQRHRRRHTDQHAQPKTLGELDQADGRWITIAENGTQYAGHLLEVRHETARTFVLLRRFKGETPEDTRRGFRSDTPIEVAR